MYLFYKAFNFIIFVFELSVLLSIGFNSYGATNPSEMAKSWPNPTELNIIEQSIATHPVTKINTTHRVFLDANTPLIINNTIFNVEKNYSQTTYAKEVKFFLTRFNKPAIFTLDVFMGPVFFSNVLSNEFTNFEWSIFSQDASFNYSKFLNQINFYGVVFKNKATFYATEYDNANFTNVHFYNEAIFSFANYKGRVLFDDAIFRKKALFDATLFKSSTSFSHTIFYDDVVFDKAIFLGPLDFSHSQFLGSVSFDGATLPPYLNFSYIENVSKNISFKKINLAKENVIKINLLRSDINQIIFDYTFFALYFPPEASDSDIKSIYESLLKTQKNNGFENGYKKLSIEYSTYQYMSSGNYLGYFFDKYMWNFGFDKAHLISIIGYIVLFFTLINNLFYGFLQKEIHSIPFLNVRPPNSIIEKNFFFRYLFYLPIALIYTVLVMFKGFFDQNVNLQSKKFYVSLYILLMIISGIFSTFLILQYIVKD